MALPGSDRLGSKARRQKRIRIRSRSKSRKRMKSRSTRRIRIDRRGGYRSFSYS
jgi:hypothetical protein